MKNVRMSLAVPLCLLAATTFHAPLALATGQVTIPEPDILSLLAIGGAAAVVVWVRSRRKK